VFGLKHDAKLGNRFGPHILIRVTFLLSNFFQKTFGPLFRRLQRDSRDSLSQTVENLFLSFFNRLRRIGFGL
jgi:hypothetical protein